MVKTLYSRRFAAIVALGTACSFLLPLGTFAATTATLSLNPVSKMVVKGEELDVQIMLATNGNATDGVDIHSLRFNPAYAEIVDADAKTPGTQIQPGTLYPITTSNIVDNAKGTIQFSQITSGGTKYSGSGVLATIRLRIKDGNSVDLSFDFTAGATNDANVASSGGVDVLSSITNARFVFSNEGNMTGSYLPPGSSVPTLGTTPGGVPAGQPRVSGLITRGLYRGLRHAQVTLLQTFLISKQYLPAGNATGFFGRLTEKGVKAFQCAESIVCSGTGSSSGYGRVGVKTRARMNKLMGT